MIGIMKERAGNALGIRATGTLTAPTMIRCSFRSLRSSPVSSTDCAPSSTWIRILEAGIHPQPGKTRRSISGNLDKVALGEAPA